MLSPAGRTYLADLGEEFALCNGEGAVLVSNMETRFKIFYFTSKH